MTAHSIPFHVPHMPARGEEYVLQALRSGGHVNGSFTRSCSELLRERYGARSVLMTHSATAALEMSAMLLAAEYGARKVYMPSYTFSSTANAFVRAGYEIVFVDIDPTTMATGLPEFQAADPTPGSVLMPVHYMGDPRDADLIAAWAKEQDLLLAEDAAQALGSSIGNQQAGTFGSVAAISFHYTKNVHASLGGALYVNDPALAEAAVYVWERGTNRQAFLRGAVDKYTWMEVGSSFQGTEMQAALLLAGLEEFDEINEHRRQIWDVYDQRLPGLEERGIFTPAPSENTINHHGYFVRLQTVEDADSLRIHMNDLGIALYSHYVALHTSPLAVRLGLQRPLPNTERWAACLLRLPLHTGMTPTDANTVVDEIVGWLDTRR